MLFIRIKNNRIIWSRKVKEKNYVSNNNNELFIIFFIQVWFSCLSGSHLFVFLNGESEWLHIECSLFRSYLNHHKRLEKTEEQSSALDLPFLFHNITNTQQDNLTQDMLLIPSNIENKQGGKRKSCPRLWLIEEDNTLLRVVKSTKSPLKWPIVAKSLVHRTGKKCREQFLNHLSPKLKKASWFS